MLLLILGIGAAAVLAIAAVSAVGTARFRARYEVEKAELLQRGRAAAPPPAAPAARGALPAPVRRYLEVTGAAGRPGLRVALVRQRGAIRAAADRPWMPFESEQAYSFEPPGFLWLARARIAPLVPLLARDRFVGGRGHMLIRLLGAFTLADGRGPEIDQGAGLRYWAEAICFPELVLDPRLRWEPIDERRARLAVDQDGLHLAAVVEFDEAGFPAATHADRYRDVGGKGVLTPWSGFSRDWKAVDGRLFPAAWSSVWHLPEGDLEAVRMEIVSLRTEPRGGP